VMLFSNIFGTEDSTKQTIPANYRDVNYI
jgi:hypothetical protein